MKESTKPRIGRMLGDSPSREMDKVELTLGAMWPPRNTANRYRLRLAARRGSQSWLPYQRNFSAIWICLPAVAEVNSPWLVASNERLTPRKLGWFGRLNTSVRNCTRLCSVIGKFLKTEK